MLLIGLPAGHLTECRRPNDRPAAGITVVLSDSLYQVGGRASMSPVTPFP